MVCSLGVSKYFKARACLAAYINILRRNLSTIVYIDFSKPFDVVSKLFARLCSYGVRGAILSWIENFLTGRTHQTTSGRQNRLN